MSKVHEDNAGYIGVSYEETQDPYFSYNKLSLPLAESQLSAKQPAEETFTVTVANSKFVIGGVSQASLNLVEGGIYKFDQSDSSNAGHPLRFSYTEDGTHGGGQEYTLGVTTNGTPGSAGAYTKIVVPFGLHDLYYYCSVHSGYGGFANVAKDVYKFTTGLPILKTTDAFGKTLGTGNNEDPYAANLVLAIPMNGANNGTTFTDVSAAIRGTGSAKTITRTNAITKTDESNFYGSSGYYDANSSRLGVANSSDFDFGFGEYTIEVWVYPTSSGTRNIVSRSFTGGTGNYSGFILSTAGFLETVSQSAWDVNISHTLPLNTWSHCAVVRSKDTWTYFVNGVSVGSATASGSVPTGPGDLYVSYRDGQSDFFGYMQDLRIYKGVAKYATPFTNASYGMDILRYTGNGGTQTLSGLNYKPDFVWIKCLTLGHNHRLFDTLRGTNNSLATDIANSPSTASGQLTSFNNGGFSIGSNAEVNNNTQNYIAWTWKAGGAPTTDNVAAAGNVPTAGSVKVDGADLTTALAGSIQVTRLSASTEYGLSIIDYQGDGTAGDTLGHALGADPKFIIIKNRTDSTENWFVWHHSYPIPARNGFYIDLEANIQNFGLTSFNDVLPSSSVITFGTSNILNSSGDAYSAYCWTEKPGFSKFGKFTHSGSASSVSLGFRPAFVLIKNLNVNNTNWYIFDNHRDTNNAIFANVDGTENAGWAVTFNDDGFSWSAGSFNNGDLIYAAFADTSPGDAVFESLVVDQLDLKDQSGNSNNASNAGATWQTSVSKFYGGAADFSSNGKATVSGNDFAFGTGDYTIEMWVYHTALGAQATYFGDTYGSTSGVYFYKNAANYIGVYYSSQVVTGGTLIPQNAWVHVAAVRNAGTTTVYVNGSPDGSASDSTNLTVTDYGIGETPGGNSGSMEGYIQDVRVYKGIAKYSSSFTPPERSVQGTARRYPSGIYVVS